MTCSAAELAAAYRARALSPVEVTEAALARIEGHDGTVNAFCLVDADAALADARATWPASPFGPFSHVGPMARTVTDLALLLDVLAEPDARDWQTLPPARTSFAAGLDDGVEGLRIAFSPELGHAAVDPEIAGLVAKAALAFASLGAHVELRDPGFPDPRATFDVIWSTGAARAVAGLGVRAADGVDPGLEAIAADGRAFTALDYANALGDRDALAIVTSRFHEEWDLLLTPALPLAAFEAGREVPSGAADPRWPGWTPFTYPFNLTHQPAAVVPCGFTAAGLPAGLQIVGPRHADALVLRAARAYEAAHPQPVLAPL